MRWLVLVKGCKLPKLLTDMPTLFARVPKGVGVLSQCVVFAIVSRRNSHHPIVKPLNIEVKCVRACASRVGQMAIHAGGLQATFPCHF